MEYKAFLFLLNKFISHLQITYRYTHVKNTHKNTLTHTQTTIMANECRLCRNIHAFDL